MSDHMQSTNRLLRVIVALLLRREEKTPQTLRQQVAILADLGLRPSEIADVVGRTPNYVNKELASIRKTNKKGKEE